MGLLLRGLPDWHLLLFSTLAYWVALSRHTRRAEAGAADPSGLCGGNTAFSLRWGTTKEKQGTCNSTFLRSTCSGSMEKGH